MNINNKHYPKIILLCLCFISGMSFAQTSNTEVEPKWITTGFKQANAMGAGEAEIPKDGKFRVFVLMGQSNMQGAGRANELKPLYTEKHDRIRIWANGRWEYFVPTQRHGPGVSGMDRPPNLHLPGPIGETDAGGRNGNACQSVPS